MVITGYILAVSGCIACFVGQILMLKLAYHRGLGWFFACLILAPLCWLALLALHFKSSVKPFVLAVGGLIVAAVGGSMAGIELD
jgi:hypothetical protein